MQTGIGQHCGDCRRPGAAAFAELAAARRSRCIKAAVRPAANMPRAKYQKIESTVACGWHRTDHGRPERMVAVATALGTVLVAR
jgi:hypothetical protein